MADRRVGGVVVVERRVLLLRKRLNNEFRLPKGSLDAGETDEQAALREVREETGFCDLRIVADLGEQWVEYRSAGGWVEQVQRYYLMRLESFQRRARTPRDARRFEVRWADLDQALDLISFAAERQVLRRAREALGSA